jgi:hypothetical protein
MKGLAISLLAAALMALPALAVETAPPGGAVPAPGKAATASTKQHARQHGHQRAHHRPKAAHKQAKTTQPEKAEK